MKRAAAIVVLLVLVLAGVAHASNDPEYQLQYGPQQIYAPEAWAKSRGAGVTIAVVDSGIQMDHPDLADKIVSPFDFADRDNNPDDTNGHGTHVAGIAAAITDNGIGIAGVAPDARIMPLKIDFESGSPTTILDIEEAIRYASENGAEVINLSLVTFLPITGDSKTRLQTACLDAFNRGSLCIVAAGNDGKGKPSGYDHDFQAVLVAASDRNREIADFSQRADSKWGITAPGVGIHSTVPGSAYGIKQGTSMATPHVAGVAALLFAQGLTNQQVVDKLLGTATPLNDGGGTSGAGLVNAAAAVGADFAAPTTTTTIAAGPTTSQPASAGEPVVVASTTTSTTAPAPVDLEAGAVEENDFIGGRGSDFDVALGEESAAEEIVYSEGLTLRFVLAVLSFVVVICAAGIGLRKIVLRRGIGAAKI